MNPHQNEGILPELTIGCQNPLSPTHFSLNLQLIPQSESLPPHSFHSQNPSLPTHSTVRIPPSPLISQSESLPPHSFHSQNPSLPTHFTVSQCLPLISLSESPSVHFTMRIPSLTQFTVRIHSFLVIVQDCNYHQGSMIFFFYYDNLYSILTYYVITIIYCILHAVSSITGTSEWCILVWRYR